jgi:hypothetical protein
MKDTRENPLISFFGNQWYIYLAILASIPIFLTTETFVQAMDIQEDEAASAAITICIIAGIFSGRYLAQIRVRRNPVVSTSMMMGLGVLVIAGIAWLFFHADFPLRKRPAINLLLYWLPLIIISLALGFLVKLVRAVSEKQLRDAQVSAAQSKEELLLLQSQLSPHFLFNTLNNLYGLSITQYEKLPPLLLKLAELLRYSLYEANAHYVPPRDELAYINNYIAFEKIRLGERLVLQSDITSLYEDDIVIAPMLLIVLLENAFKHARDTPDQKIYITINLKIWENLILFSVKNSCGSPIVINLNSKSNGLGLVNLKKRLELIYPDMHDLNLEQQNDHYSAWLQLKIKRNA